MMPTFEFLYTVTVMAEAPDEDTARALVEGDLGECVVDFDFVKSFT